MNPNAGPLERAAALGPAQGALPDVTVSNDTRGTEGKLDTPEMEPTNIGASKVDPANPRMESFIDAGAHAAASSPLNERLDPTDPQKGANNTKLGVAEFHGLDLRIENPQGSIRQSRQDATEQWKTRMTEHYGYIAGTKGADGDAVDSFVGPKVDSQKVFVIDQTGADGKFDEHKVMLGFDSLEEAKAAYYDNYQAGWKGGEAVHETTVDGLKSWLKDGKTTEPFGITAAASPSDARASAPADRGASPLAASAPQLGPSASPSPTGSQLGQASAPSESQQSASPLTARAEGSGQSQAQSQTLTSDLSGDRPSGVENSLLGASSSPDKVADANTTSASSQNTTPEVDKSAKSPDSTGLSAGSLTESKVTKGIASGTQPLVSGDAPTIKPSISEPVRKQSSEVAQAVKEKILPAPAAESTAAPLVNALQAAKYAKDNGLNAEPAKKADGSVILQPKAQPLDERKVAHERVADLNRSLAANGERVQVKAVFDVSPVHRAVRSVIKKAFGADVVFVSANGVFDGVYHRDTIFIAEKTDAPLIAVAFHELKHQLQRSDPALSKQLYGFVKSYMNGGLVEGRIDAEHRAATDGLSAADAAKVPKLDRVNGINEAMADINGALATDPAFWRAMAQHDESLFRKTVYKVMELLTKAITIAKGSHFDIDRMVTDKDAVQEAIAKGWATYNASREEKQNGQAEPAFSRTEGDREDRGNQAAAQGLRDDGGARGSARVLDESPGQDAGLAPLTNLAATVTVDGKRVTFGPFAPAREAAANYMKEAGLPYKRQTEYMKVDEQRAQRIAEEFDRMQHDPADPKVKASYDAMIKETLAQYQAIKATGLKVEFIDFEKTGDPYGNPRNAILDVVNNNHLWVFPTDLGFGGSESADVDISGNPLLARTDEKISGKTALANDIFRVVHDYFGHIKEGVGFRAEGEENAWQQHATMYSDLARPAMTSETRGQNSWVNFGPYAEFNKTANGADTQYAPQKVGLMADWTSTNDKVQFTRKLEAATNVEQAFALANSKSFATNRELKLELQARAIAAEKSAEKRTDPEYLKNIAITDARYALKSNANAVGWYDDKVSTALNVLATIHPEIKTDPKAKFAFTWALAVTSNGLKVGKNFELAEKTYSLFKKTGQMPTNVGIGTAGPAINDGLTLFNHLAAEWGMDKLMTFMTTKLPVKQIEKETGLTVGGEGKATEVYGAAVLGPKIGNGFFMNLYGKFDQLTMDRWLMRTWGRWTGTLIEVNKDAVKAKLVELKEVIGQMDAAEKKAFSEIIKVKMNAPIMTVGNAIWKATTLREKREQMNALPHGEQLRKLGNRVGAIADGQKEAPNGSKERNLIRSVFAQALEQLRTEHPALTMADLQALLWYPEKRLYDSAKSDSAGDEGYDDSAAPDYANAAAKLARDKGIDQQTIDEASNGRFTAAAGRAPEKVSGDQVEVADTAAPRYSRSRLGDIRTGPSVSVREQKSDALAPIVGVHYGKKPGLEYLEGAYNGTGIAGAEQARLKFAKDARIKQRIYFYNDLGGERLQVKEGGLGNNVYATKLGNLYDLKNDPARIFESMNGLTDKVERMNTLEEKIVQAGYDGYTDGRMTVVMGGAIPVQFLGDHRLERIQFSRKDLDFKDVTKRTPELTAAAAQVKDGTMSAAEYATLVNKYKPVEPYTSVPEPETVADMQSALTANKVEKIGLPQQTLSAGDRVGLRLDIPAYKDHGVWVVSVHEGRGDVMAGKAGAVVGYESAASVTDASMGMHQGAALGIATGKAKATIATIEGAWKPISPDEAKAAAQKALADPSWRQVGMDPERHGYFYDRDTMEPVTGAAEVIQIGGLVLARTPVYGDKGDFAFSRKPPEWIAQVPGMTPAIAQKVGAWVPGKSLRQRFDDLRADFGKKFIQGVMDQFAPIKELDMKAYMQARLSKSQDGGIEAMLLYGKLHRDADGAITVDNTGGFVDTMKKLQGEQDRFFSWVAGNRAADLKAQGKENLFTDTDITALRGANQGTMPDGTSRAMLYASTLREMNQFSKTVLDIAEQAGTIDGASRALWEKDFYVPFYRLAEDDGKTFGPTNIAGLTNQYAFKKLKGGTDNLNDLMQNTIMNWAHLMSSALKNQAAASALTAAEAAGVAHQVPIAQKGSLFVLDRGQKVHYMVDDPFIMTAVSSLTFTGIKGTVVDAATAAKRALSFGVTFSPSYRLRNLIRDQLQAVGANPMSLNIAKNLVDGVKFSSKDNPLYAQMLAGGALFRMGSSYEDNRAANLKRMVGQIQQSTLLTSNNKVLDVLRKGYDLYMETGDKAESITRAAIYSQMIAQGKSHMEASYATRDSMDFGLQGSWPAVRLLAQTVPFFNARVQGLYKLGRAAKDDPKRFALVLGATTMATIAIMLANHDDDDWKQREEWDRDNFWWFKVGGTAFRIPKPFEMGAMATIAERGLELVMAGMDEKSRVRFASRVSHILGDNLSMNPIPQLIKPALDLYANRDPFRNRPIETPGMEKMSVKERIGGGTTATAQLLGKAGVLSPVQIDYAIQGYFGWLGAHMAMTTDMALRPAMGLPEKPTRKIDDTFVVGDWVKELPSAQSRFVTDFYDKSKQIQEVVADMNHYKQIGNREKAIEIRDQNIDLLKQRNHFSFATTQMNHINSRLRQVNQSASMSAEAKRQEIDRLTSMRNKLAEKVVN